MVLQTVVCQELVPDKNGGLAPAFEIMHMNSAIRSLIRDGKTHQLMGAIASGGEEGMITMDQCLTNLCKEGVISKETALEFAENPDQINRRLGN